MTLDTRQASCQPSRVPALTDGQSEELEFLSALQRVGVSSYQRGLHGDLSVTFFDRPGDGAAVARPPRPPVGQDVKAWLASLPTDDK